MQRNRDYRLLIWTLSGLKSWCHLVRDCFIWTSAYPRFFNWLPWPLHEVNRGYIGHYVQMGFLRPFRKKCIAPVSSPSTFEDLSLQFSFLFIFSLGLLLFLPFLMVNKGALIPITKTWICDPIRKRWTAEIYWYVGIGECGVRGWADAAC